MAERRQNYVQRKASRAWEFTLAAKKGILGGAGLAAGIAATKVGTPVLAEAAHLAQMATDAVSWAVPGGIGTVVATAAVGVAGYGFTREPRMGPEKQQQITTDLGNAKTPREKRQALGGVVQAASYSRALKLTAKNEERASRLSAGGRSGSGRTGSGRSDRPQNTEERNRGGRG